MDPALYMLSHFCFGQSQVVHPKGGSTRFFVIPIIDDCEAQCGLFLYTHRWSDFEGILASREYAVEQARNFCKTFYWSEPEGFVEWEGGM